MTGAGVAGAGVALIGTGGAGTGGAGVARVGLATLPTPLVLAPRLAEVVGAGALYVKRDDLTGFAFAGNKARPLEFLLAAALGEGADTVVTGGAPSSNFCAAAKALALVSRYAGDGNVVFWHTGGQLDAVALAAAADR